MIKAIFFDIDGTLIASNGKALASTREAIKQAQANGVLCGIATGRGPVDLEKVIDYLSLDMFITYNGQYVYTKENLIYAKPFPKQTLEAIVEYADENYRQVMFGGETQVAGSLTIRLSQSPVMQRYLRYVPKKFPVGFLKKVLQRFSPNRNAKRYESLDILREPIYQCIMLSPESEREKLRSKLPQCDFKRSNAYSVDIVPKNGSKIKGIKEFLAYEGIAMEEAMAFGDHFNDVEMLEGVGIGVAMGNAQPVTKASADFVTDTNDHDGIKKALIHFGIIAEDAQARE
ncbi:Cof-type HAD-IIB family hydrolase [Enterococcus casseliflavus]|uniref:Cof-type HAD-IIB family hydrolase n=1 Tax=Enterococcus casseliflavus TaxID=37734 RepID=UPI0039A53930